MGKSHTTATLDRMCKHLRVLGFDERTTHLVLNVVKRWELSCGPEWTITRLKTIKENFVHLLAGEKVDWKWFSHKGDIPKGIFGRLIRLGLTQQKYQSKVLSALHVYTAYRFSSLTRKQYNKAVESISQQDLHPVDHGSIPFMGKWSMGLKGTLGRPKVSFSFASLSSGVSPTFYPKGDRWLNSLCDDCGRGTPFGGLLRQMGLPNSVEWNKGSFHAGSILFLQEKGGKARVVACPTAGAQVAFRPLHAFLNRMLVQIEQDCTFDQQGGIIWSQKELRKGKTLFSFDLSSATDRFPLWYQVNVLKDVCPVYAAPFRDFVRNGTWEVRAQIDGESQRDRLSYAKGQPMGLYGSFPLFALSHHYLLQGIWRHSLSKKGKAPYRVLGDDVVISDPELASTYQKYMEKLGVEISLPKSNVSKTVAQFAGKVITSRGIIDCAKVPRPESGLENSFINYLKVTGIKGLKCLPSRVRRVARIVAELPEWEGGLGLNPKGLPLSDRMLSASELLKVIPEGISLRASLISTLASLGGKPPVVQDRYREVIAYVNDQLTKVEDQLMELIPWQYRQVPTNLRQLAVQFSSFTGRCSALSYAGTRTRRGLTKPFKTQLQIWEKKIGKSASIEPIGLEPEV